MLQAKTYSCGICKTTPDQISHHKSHVETQKHKDKRELFELKLSQLGKLELEQLYQTTNIHDILMETETIRYTNLPTKSQKMKKKSCDPVDEIINTMIEETKIEETKIEETNSISNKEALKDKIHEIHNYLRNNGAGYGMNALKVFNILYGLKKIEENGLLDKVNLAKPDCEFSYLLKLAHENKDEQLADLIFGNVLQSICDSELRDLLFYEIPQNIRGSVFVYLIKEIDRITLIEKTCNVLLSGKIYEYFIGRDESAISELGAYFTDRHIVEYILSKLDPSRNPDGTILSMIDMFGGSGGFTTGYIHYLNEKYPKAIDWTTEIHKISHFDMNEDVIKSAGLELFCLTGVLPNMNHLKYKNSFTDEFNGQKYKYILTNPPYGGDKMSKTETQLKREKVKEYIKQELQTITEEGLRIRRQKQLKQIETQEKQEKKESDKAKVSVSMCSARIQKFAKEHGLRGNDKESCSLMLLMDMLEVGGTAIGVLKEGVFFNKTYKDIRKCLVEHFNVREVISVPQDQFENTSTKTSIVIFDHTEEKTTEVLFRDLVVERYAEDKFAEVLGDIVILENKDDIFRVRDTLVSTATREQILGNVICSLNGKDYNKKEMVVNEGYELIRLGDICESQNGYAFKTMEYKNEGVPLITITHIKNERLCFNHHHYIEENTKYEKYEIRQHDVVISLTGKKPNLCSIGIQYSDEKQYLNQRCAILRNFKKINPFYFACLFQAFMVDYIDTNIGNGSNQENVSLTDILNIPIPLPTSESTMEEWKNRILTSYHEKNTKQTRIKELEIFIAQRIQEREEREVCDEMELDRLCDIQYGTRITKKENTLGNIPVYGGGDITFYTHQPNRDKNTLIISRYALSECCVRLLHTAFYLNDSGLSLHSKDKEMQNYIYYVLLQKKNQEYIYKNCTAGSIQHNLNMNLFRNMKIKIPRNRFWLEEINQMSQQIETLYDELAVAEEAHAQLIQELRQAAIPTQIKMTDTEIKTEIKYEQMYEECLEEMEHMAVSKKKITIKKKRSSSPHVV
jgi:restriction endonuclease S subunit